MKSYWLLGMVLSVLLTGCQSPDDGQETFLVGDWLCALDEKFGYLDGSSSEIWMEGLNVSDTSVLTKEVMSVTLARAIGIEPCTAHFADASAYAGADEIQALLDVGYIALENGQLKGKEAVDRAAAMNILEKANNDYTSLTFPKTHYEVAYTQSLRLSPIDFEGSEGTAALVSGIEEDGLYQFEDHFYWVTVGENEIHYRKAALDEIVQELELQTTFRPDLSESLKLKSESSPIDLTGSKISAAHRPIQLKSQYFAFPIKGLNVSGHVSSSSLEVTLKGKVNGFEIEDTFSISDLEITADASLNPLQKQKLLLRVDYQLDNVISAQKKAAKPVDLKKIQASDLAAIRARIESLTDLALTASELDLVTFEFPIPGTMQMLQVGLNLKLYIGLNGEVGLSFSSSQSHGIKVVNGQASRIQRHEQSVHPYLEGSAELTGGLSVDLRGFGHPLVDFAVETGVGAEAKTQVHFVNTREKLVDAPVYAAPLTELEDIVAEYQGSQEAFIDLCADVDIYWLIRLRIGSSSTLASRFGLSGSWTPLKKSLSLLHVENHRDVGSCTRDYTFIEDAELPQGLHLSSQTLSLQPGQTAQLSMNDANGTVSAKFVSENPAVATVSEKGVIEAKGAGITVIKATNSSGITLSCVVYIPENLEVEFSPLNAASFFIF